MWILIAGVFVWSAVAVRFARQLAFDKGLLDVPNERSSHKQPVPRLGGAAFMPVVLLAVGLLAPRGGLPGVVFTALLGGAIALFAVSLVDDFFPLSTTIRFAVQFAAAGGFLFALWLNWPDGSAISSQLSPLRPLSPVPCLLSPAFWLLTLWIVRFPQHQQLHGWHRRHRRRAGRRRWDRVVRVWHTPVGSVCDLSRRLRGRWALGFLTLNWPPAKIFMGDAGSTVLGYLFATVPLVAVVESRWAVRSARGGSTDALLVVWPFLADGTFTILRRLKNRENILKAHRSHLYQRLVIAGRSHLQVTLVYGGLAVLGAVLGFEVLSGTLHAVLVAFGVIVVAFAGLWLWTLYTERYVWKERQSS